MTEEYNRLPLIGDKAPAFQALTTNGTIHFPEDYEGKWVLFFSHPSDFTPVCTTEFMTMASMKEEFRDMNVELLGLSVDSLYSHIAWIRRIEELEWNGLKNVKIDFPVIADLNTKVSTKYGAMSLVSTWRLQIPWVTCTECCCTIGRYWTVLLLKP